MNTPKDDTLRHTLTDYQLNAVVGLQGVIARAVNHQLEFPAKRYDIARKGGMMLLQAPTASGKTLMLGRTLDGLVGRLGRKMVWFWFAPFSGLIVQTADALAEQCPSLRIRDASTDREPRGSKDGDIFLSTWGAVAANNQDARRVRRTTESTYALDQMLELLRIKGYGIGVVIDEAHLNFSTSADVAAKFYLETLRPDVTLLATATPNDEKLKAFQEKTSVEVESRIVVSRDDVVSQRLNKHGLALGVMRLRDQDQDLVDAETSALSCGWHQHNTIKARLNERGLDVVPLMMVQVENQEKGEQNPIDRVKEKLTSIGVPESVIATHSSGKPDPNFHSIAFDPSKEVLIFKVAAATGFDAPRAWTLVSVRPSRGKEFGLQIVGRIMRVHPAYRPFHGQDPLLDRGYVFLTDDELQSGLNDAADALDAVVSSINIVTNNLDLVELGTSQPLASDGWGRRRLSGRLPDPPTSDEDRQNRLNALLEKKAVPSDMGDRSVGEQDRSIQVAEQFSALPPGDLFGGNLPEVDAPNLFETPQRSRGLKTQRYNLRTDLNIPRFLSTESPPKPEVLNSDEYNRDLAKQFIRNSSVLERIHGKMGTGTLELKDVFDDEYLEIVDNIRVRLDDTLITENGQKAFDFDTQINQRKLKAFLLSELKILAIDKGLDFQDHDLKRAIYLAAMREPHLLREAVKGANSGFIQTQNAEYPIPEFVFDLPNSIQSHRSVYGIIPSDLNKPETKLANWLDEEPSGRVLWWLRNQSRAGYTKGWGTNLVLPSGGFFFPDFVVRVRGRSNKDEILLIEMKGEGLDNTTKSLEKISVRHREYMTVLWGQVYNDGLVRLEYNRMENRIVPSGSLDYDFLINTT